MCNNMMKAQSSLRLATVPGPTDILCGKTKECMLHDGTKRFRDVIDGFKETYAQALTKFDKMCLTRKIVELLKSQSSGTRFLKFNEKLSVWEELSEMAARDKVGHALRFANRTTKRRSKKVSSEKNIPRKVSSDSVASTSTTSSTGSAMPNVAFSLNSAVQCSFEKSKKQPVALPSLTNFAPCDFGPLLGTNQQPKDLEFPVNMFADIPMSFATPAPVQDDQTMADTMKLVGETMALLDSTNWSSSSADELSSAVSPVPTTAQATPLDDEPNMPDFDLEDMEAAFTQSSSFADLAALISDEEDDCEPLEMDDSLSFLDYDVEDVVVDANITPAIFA